jgi:hypothetical protein
MARRVTLGEPVEHRRQPLGWDARAAVLDDDRDHGVVGFQRHLDGRAGSVLARVVEQVAQDPLEPPRVGLDDERSFRDVDRRLVEARADDRAHERDEVDGLGGHLLDAGVEPRDLHEVVDEDSQAAHVGHEELAGAPAVRRQVVDVLAQDRRLGHERRRPASAARATRRRRTGGCAPRPSRAGRSSRPGPRPSG